jgi:geranylgeranyl pyrophosphate synthase
VTKAVKLLDRVGARDFTEQYESKFAESALSNLGAANPEGQAAEALYQLTNNLLSREK